MGGKLGNQRGEKPTLLAVLLAQRIYLSYRQRCQKQARKDDFPRLRSLTAPKLKQGFSRGSRGAGFDEAGAFPGACVRVRVRVCACAGGGGRKGRVKGQNWPKVPWLS